MGPNPQQSTEPSSFSPQTWSVPTLTDMKESSGGEIRLSNMLPQQTKVLSCLNPQALSAPALT